MVRLLPAKRQLVRLGAMMSPGLKSSYSLRLLAAVAKYVNSDDLLPTNMGFSANYKCLIPRDKSIPLFGKPEHYAGERGPLRLAGLLSQGADCFLDVGAHIGYYTFYMRHQMSEPKPIFYFEPNQALFEIIANNVRANRLPNVTGYQAALGATDGTAKFYLNLSDSASSSLTPAFRDKHQTAVVEVPTVRYCTFVKEHGLKNTCIKVDVEGAEEAFINGAAGAMDTISCLIMEMLASGIRRQLPSRLINDYGFEAYYINDFRLEYSLDGSFTYQAPHYNWLFCRHAPECLQTMVEPYGFELISQPG